MVNDVVSIGSLVVAGAVAIWGIYQTWVTKRLERELYRLNAGLDQSIQRLHRAREAVIKWHQAYLFLLHYAPELEAMDSTYAAKSGEMSAYQAELRGLAFAIGDEELLNLVNRRPYSTISEDVSRAERTQIKEMEIRGYSQKLHTRISELLQEETIGQMS